MSTSINIGYIGNDNLFLGKIESFIAEVKSFDCNLIQFNYKQGHIYHFLKESSVHLFIIDINCEELNLKLLTEISKIKKLETFKSTVFCAALDNRDKNTFDLIQSIGFSLGYLKGTEEKLFLTDALFLATGTLLKLPSFASAYRLKVKNEVSISSSIAKFNLNDLTIESDIVFDTTNFNLHLPMFEKTRLNSIEPKRISECYGQFNYLYLMECEFKFLGPWDTADESSIYEEDLANWIDLNSESLKHLCDNICVFSKSVSFYDEVFDNELDSCIEIRDHLSGEEDIDLLKSLGAKVVLIELDDDIDLEKSLALIKESSYLDDDEMIFILFNCNSTSMALRKLSGTNNVLASKFNLSVDLYKVFIDKFISTRKKKNNQSDFVFSPFDQKRLVDIYFNIDITTLSEHEVCFLSEFEIPYFTVLHSQLPVPFYFTIIPETRDLKKHPDYFHYQAIIHTVNELNFDAMRRVVNSLIINPVDEFTDASVSELNSLPSDDEIIEEKVEESKQLLSDVNNVLNINNRDLNKKSKL